MTMVRSGSNSVHLRLKLLTESLFSLVSPPPG